MLLRWPTALALGTAALILEDVTSDEGVVTFAGLLLLPLEYLIVAKLQRRQATWPVIAVVFLALLALQALDVVAPATVFAAVALLVLVWGGVDGQLSRRVPGAGAGDARLWCAGAGRAGGGPRPWLLAGAAGWFVHGVWDFVYLKLDRVVARSYAEWCGVLDILVAAGLVFLS